MSPPLELLITRDDNSFSREIQRQVALTSLVHASVLTQENLTHLVNFSPTPLPDIIIHFAGFCPPSLSETLHHSSYLHQLLAFATRTRAKFYLVLSSTPSSHHDLAISLVTEYAQKYSLTYTIFETDPDTAPSTVAYTILKPLVPHRALPFPSWPSPAPKPVGTVFTIVFLVLFLPWVFVFSQLAAVYLLYRCSYSALRHGHWQTVQTCASLASTVSRLLLSQTRLTPGLGLLDPYLGVSLPGALVYAPQLSDSLIWAATLASDTQPLLTSLVNSSAPTPTSLSALAPDLTHLTESLTSLQTHLPDILPPHSPYQEQFSNRLSSTRQLVTKLSQLAPQLPTLLAYGTDKTYLLLLHDPSQLRPAGGIVTHAAFLTLHDGHLTHIELHPASGIDAHLLGDVSAPQSFTQATGELTWHFSDSTWDPDFAISATQALWFIQKGFDRPLSGVISLNLSVFPTLLASTGPLTISSHQVASTNFTSTYLSSLGSTASQSDFILSTLQAFQTFASSPTANPHTLLYKLLIQLESRQLAWYFPDSTTQALFASVGWSGGLPLADNLIYQLDSNLSHQSVSDHLIHTTSATVNLNQSQISTTLKFDYTYTSTSQFTNLVQIYLPSIAHLTEVSLDSGPVPASAYTLTKSGPYSLVSFPLTFAPSTHHLLQVTYDQPFIASSQATYHISILNQPGAAPLNFSLAVTYPPTWGVTVQPHPSVASSGLLKYNLSLSRPTYVDLSIKLPFHP